MSFLPNFMGGRRQPLVRQASTAEVNASVHAQALISTPSRRDSMSSLSSAFKGLPPKNMAPAESSLASSSTLANGQSSSTHNANSKLRLETVFPVTSSPDSSMISLVSSPDEESVPRKRSLEYEWTDVNGDSTDEDIFSGTDRDSIRSDDTHAPIKDNEVPTSASDEHEVVVPQLKTELSTAQSEASTRLINVQRKEEEIFELQAKLEALEKKSERLTQESVQNRELWDEEKGDMVKQMNTLHDRHRKIMIELERRTQACVAMEEDKERQRSEKYTAIKQLEEKITLLDEENDTLKERLVDSESGFDDMVKHIANNEKKILELGKQVTHLQEQIANLQHHIFDLEGKWNDTYRDQGIRIENILQQKRHLEELLAHKEKEQECHDTTPLLDKIEKLERFNQDLQAQIDYTKETHSKNMAQVQQLLSEALAEEQAKTVALEKELASANESYLKTRKLYKCSTSARRHLKHQLDLLNQGSINPTPTSLPSSSTFTTPELTNCANEEVYQVLQSLNYEIFQTAALLTDSLSSIYHPVSLNPDLTLTSSTTLNDDTLSKAITTYLGPYLLNLLQIESQSSDYNILPLQTVIQSTLVFACTRIMSAWYPPNWDISDFLNTTYTLIHTSEGAHIAEAWKSTTKSRLKPTTNITSSIIDFLFEILSIVIHLAGWPTTKDLSGIESLLNKYKDKFSSLANYSLKLNVIFDTTNPQLEPALAEAGSLFDYNLMEIDGEEVETEDYNTSNGFYGDRVVCTSEIGIKKVNELRFQRGYSSSGCIMLKPKVILRSTFEV